MPVFYFIFCVRHSLFRSSYTCFKDLSVIIFQVELFSYTQCYVQESPFFFSTYSSNFNENLQLKDHATFRKDLISPHLSFFCLIPFLLFIVSAFMGPTLGGFLYEKIGFEWAAAVQGFWALTSVSNQSFIFIFFVWRNLTWRLDIH